MTVAGQAQVMFVYSNTFNILGFSSAMTLMVPRRVIQLASQLPYPQVVFV